MTAAEKRKKQQAAALQKQRSDDWLGVGRGRYPLPRHSMPSHSRREGSQCVELLFFCIYIIPVPGLIDSARHVISCNLTQDTRVPNALEDVASGSPQTLIRGGREGRAGGVGAGCDHHFDQLRHRPARRRRDGQQQHHREGVRGMAWQILPSSSPSSSSSFPSSSFFSSSSSSHSSSFSTSSSSFFSSSSSSHSSSFSTSSSSCTSSPYSFPSP